METRFGQGQAQEAACFREAETSWWEARSCLICSPRPREPPLLQAWTHSLGSVLTDQLKRVNPPTARVAFKDFIGFLLFSVLPALG